MSSSDVDFGASLDRFIQYLELELGRSKNTATAYRKDLENLIAELLNCDQAILFPCGYMANLAIADVFLNLDNNNSLAIHDQDLKIHQQLLDLPYILIIITVWRFMIIIIMLPY